MHDLFFSFFLKLVLEIYDKSLLIEIVNYILIIDLFEKMQNRGPTLIFENQNHKFHNLITYFSI